MLYEITAKADQPDLSRRWSWVSTPADLPRFTVDAATADEALALARAIIDPARMTSTDITVAGVPRAAWRAALESELQDAVHTLRRDPPELDGYVKALRGLAETVAAYTGQDWGQLMKGEEES